MKPSVSRSVHYVTKFGHHRPAVIVEVHEDGTVDLTVFTAFHNDPPGSYRGGAASGLAFVERAPYSEDPEPYTWHAPERV